jgi:hypothetical protein
MFFVIVLIHIKFHTKKERKTERQRESETIPHERPFHAAFPGLSPYSHTKAIAMTLRGN